MSAPGSEDEAAPPSSPETTTPPDASSETAPPEAPPPDPRRFRLSITLVLTVFLVLVVALAVLAAGSEPRALPIAGARATLRVVDRNLYAAHDLEAVLVEADELLRDLDVFADSHDPTERRLGLLSQATRAVLWAEAGPIAYPLQLGRWIDERTNGDFEAVLGCAYRATPPQDGCGDALARIDAGPLLPTPVEPKIRWAYDVLRWRVASAHGSDEQEQHLADILRRTGLRARIGGYLSAAVMVVLWPMTAVVLLAVFWRRRPWNPGAESAIRQPPWTFAQGYAVLVRGLFLYGFLLMVLLGVLHALVPRTAIDGPAIDSLFVIVGSLLALTYASRRLLLPVGRSTADTFGLDMSGWSKKRALLVSSVVGGLIAVGAGLAIVARLSTGRLGWSDDIAVVSAQTMTSPLATAIFVLHVIVVAPITEELLYRGWIQMTLRKRFGAATAVVGSALPFALVHLYELPGFVSVFWMGLVAGVAHEVTRSLWPCILGHMAFNIAALALSNL